MPSPFYNEIVKILTTYLDNEDAIKMIDAECQLNHLSPESLKLEDSSLLILQLMSKVNGAVTSDEWNVLDQKFKSLLHQGHLIRGKVRGIVLNNILDYVLIKRGRNGVEEIRKRVKLNTDFKAESWYNIVILDELLHHINDYLGNNKSVRCKDVGNHVVSPPKLLTSHYWFGKNHVYAVDAFSNINELLNLHNFRIEQSANQLKMMYEDFNSNCFNNFLVGIFEEICKIRNLTQSQILIEPNGGNIHEITINLMDGGAK